MPYVANEIVMNEWSAKPRRMIQVKPTRSPDGWKSRAESLLCSLKPYYSHRLGYVLSPAKFAKFEALYLAGYGASDITGELIPPRTQDVSPPKCPNRLAAYDLRQWEDGRVPSL